MVVDFNPHDHQVDTQDSALLHDMMKEDIFKPTC